MVWAVLSTTCPASSALLELINKPCLVSNVLRRKNTVRPMRSVMYLATPRKRSFNPQLVYGEGLVEMSNPRSYNRYIGLKTCQLANEADK